MMNKVKNIVGNIGIIVTLAFTVFMMNASTKVDEVSPNEIKSNHSLPQVVKPPKIAPELFFAGEQIPINVDTRERLDREFLVNSYYHSSSVIAMKNASRYFPIIEKILAEEGVPADFKFLSVVIRQSCNVRIGTFLLVLLFSLRATIFNMK